VFCGFVQEGVAIVRGGGGTDAAEFVLLFFAVDDFGGGEAVDLVFERRPRIELGEFEFAGAEIERGEPVAAAAVVE